MKNYLFVITVVGVVVSGILVYKTVTPPQLTSSVVSSVLSKPKPSTKVDTVTVIRITPDGTSTTTITDKTTVNAPRKNRVDVGVSIPYNDIKGPKVYDISLSRQVIENVWVGGTVFSDKKIGLKVGIEF